MTAAGPTASRDLVGGRVQLCPCLRVHSEGTFLRHTRVGVLSRGMKGLGSLPPPATTVVPRYDHRVSAGTLPLAPKKEGVSYPPCQVHRLLWAAEFMECGHVLQANSSKRTGGPSSTLLQLPPESPVSIQRTQKTGQGGACL